MGPIENFLLSVASGLFANGLGGGFKNPILNIKNKLSHGVTLNEDLIRNHHLQRSIVRSYLKAIMDIYYQCIWEKENTNEYHEDSISISGYKRMLKAIDKDIKKIDRTTEHTLFLEFRHLKFLLIPEQAEKEVLDDINCLLINNMPQEYKLDSELFKVKAESLMFEYTCKYFAYEIKTSKETSEIFNAQMNALQHLKFDNLENLVKESVEEQAQEAVKRFEFLSLLAEHIQYEFEFTRKMIKTAESNVKQHFDQSFQDLIEKIWQRDNDNKLIKQLPYLLKTHKEVKKIKENIEDILYAKNTYSKRILDLEEELKYLQEESNPIFREDIKELSKRLRVEKQYMKKTSYLLEHNIEYAKFRKV